MELFEHVAKWVKTDIGTLVATVGTLAALGSLLFGKGVWANLGGWRDAVVAAMLKPFTSGARAEEFVKTKFDVLEANLAAILTEVRPNGGGSMRDAITRIEARQERWASRQDHIFAALAEAVLIYETDEHGQYTWASPSLATFVGVQVTDIQGWGWVNILHPDDVERVRHEWRSAVDERRLFSCSYRLCKADGGFIKVQAKARPMVVNEKLFGWSGSISVSA